MLIWSIVSRNSCLMLQCRTEPVSSAEQMDLRISNNKTSSVTDSLLCVPSSPHLHFTSIHPAANVAQGKPSTSCFMLLGITAVLKVQEMFDITRVFSAWLDKRCCARWKKEDQSVSVLGLYFNFLKSDRKMEQHASEPLLKIFGIKDPAP